MFVCNREMYALKVAAAGARLGRRQIKKEWILAASRSIRLVGKDRRRPIGRDAHVYPYVAAVGGD